MEAKDQIRLSELHMTYLDKGSVAKVLPQW